MFTKSGRKIDMSKRLYFFDENTSAMTIIKLFAFMSKRERNYRIFGHPYEFTNKDGKKKYIFTDKRQIDIISTKSTPVINDVKVIVNSNSRVLKLNYNDYFISIGDIGFGNISVGRHCDNNMLFFRKYYDCNKNYNMLRCITNILYNDRFKDGGFNSFIEDCKHAILFYERRECDFGTVVYNKYFKTFFATNIKRCLNYNPNKKYNRMHLNMMFLLSEKTDLFYNINYKFGPIDVRIRKKYLYIDILGCTVYGKRADDISTYFIENINQLDEKTINVISYILNEFPRSIQIRDDISKRLVCEN